MKLAALYDIHGNLPALEAVLEDVGRADVDEIIVGGDVTLGPMPREVLDRLREVPVPVRFLKGNCDVAVLAERLGTETGYGMPESVMKNVRWTAANLRPGDVEMSSAWPMTQEARIDRIGKVLFCHATPRNETEIFTARTSEERLLPVFQGIDANLVVCGHTHMQFDRTVAGIRVVNAGSVGMPFGTPGAYWLELGPEVRLRRTEYSRERAAELFRAADYPGAESFAADVVSPHSVEEIMQRFEAVELR